jgi:phosphatidylserine/phosphatidylglycerophosphate/cardiolipin synthase-like enzyme
VTPPRLTLNLKQPSSALVDLSEGGPEEEVGGPPAHASRLFRSASKATSVSEQFGPDLMTRGFAVDAQCVRSLGLWSGASPGEKDTSLMKAMIALITSAQRFIYIEK